MRPSEVLLSRVEDEVLIIECKGNGYLWFIGATTPTSIQPKRWVTTLVTRGEKGIIALVVTDAKKNKIGFLLSLEYYEGKPYVNLDKRWMPTADRMGQIDDYNLALSVSIGEDIFTSEEVSGNLLCRYLVGQATEEEVRAAARKQSEKISAVEEVKRLTQELALTRGDLQRLEKREKTFEEGMVEIINFLRGRIFLRPSTIRKKLSELLRIA